jgi:AraC-like DNA-binding protein
MLKLSNRFSNAFTRILISFIIIVILNTALLGIVFYHYFTDSFNEKIETINYKMLEYMDGLINEKVFNLANKTFVNFILTDEVNRLFDDGLPDNLSKITVVYDKMKQFVHENSDMIDSINLYFRDPDVFLSSSGGIRYLGSNSSFLPPEYTEMLDGFLSVDDPIVWTGKYDITQDDYLMYSATKSVFLAFFSYPINVPANKSRGCLLINFKEAAVKNILEQSYFHIEGSIFLINENNDIITSHSTGNLLGGITYDLLLEDPHLFDEQYETVVKSIDGIESIISTRILGVNNWKLVNITPVEIFYKDSILLQRTLIIVCLFVLIIIIFLANMFSKNLYNPVKLLVKNTLTLIGQKSTYNNIRSNEYKFLNNVVNDFSDKVNKLETTMQNNESLIRHTLVQDLFIKTIKDETEFESRLSLVGIRSGSNCMWLILLNINNSMLTRLNTKENQYVKYSVLEYIEKQCQEISSIPALVSNNEIGMIAIQKKEQPLLINELINKILKFSDSFKITVSASVSTPCYHLQDIYDSVHLTRELMQYSYFYPNIRIFTKDMVQDRLTNEDKVSSKYLEGLKNSLNTGCRVNIISALDDIAEMVSSSSYSANNCHKILNDALFMVSQHYLNIRININEILDRDIHKEYKEITDIQQYRLWLTNIIDSVFSHLDKINNNKTSTVVTTAIEFLENNLEKPLSLDMLSEIIHINSSYLSKAFKDETGENFSNYLNRKRLEKARSLIESGDMKIQEISLKVGFNNTNYFIKKFKQMYGTTPGLYNLHSRKKDPPA